MYHFMKVLVNEQLYALIAQTDHLMEAADIPNIEASLSLSRPKYQCEGKSTYYSGEISHVLDRLKQNLV